MGGELKGVAMLLMMMVLFNGLVLLRAQENRPSPSPSSQSNFKFDFGEAICGLQCAKDCQFPSHLRAQCMAECMLKCMMKSSPSPSPAADPFYTCTLGCASSVVSTALFHDKYQLEGYEKLPQVANFIAFCDDKCKEKYKNV
ncbi:uncharacterized protein LOC126682830 [Mercurialis annua]|uniref:uncharacterized protein LOC126682830 n=1 Tax=Mercurialis annua TaxID=3986 RepID=UPI00215F8644|nr:uncharacterized protein LOC126682830 [Mercurialis annua]